MMRTLTSKQANSSATIRTMATLTERLSLALVRKYRAHRTASALSALDDSELEDIGLVRADIHSVAHHAAL